MNKYIAEFFGTFVLTLVVFVSIIGFFPVSTAVLAAVTVGTLVYLIAHISGAQLNPAVTIGAFSIGKINLKDAFFYIVAQFLGAGFAVLIVKTFLFIPQFSGQGSSKFTVAETLGTLILMFSIASFAYGKTEKTLSGIVIGGGLLIGIAISASMGALGILNPAIAIGFGVYGLSYIIGPIIGSVLGANIYKFFFLEK